MTIFESILAKFVLEHPSFYQDAYIKMLEGLVKKACSKKLERQLFGLFSLVGNEYENYFSLDDIKNKFHLPAADYLVKLLADNIFPPRKVSPQKVKLFQERSDSPRSPINQDRNTQLFAPEHRGVVESHGKESVCKSLGIVEDSYRPDELNEYFEHDNYPSGQLYTPNEKSYVASWLRERNCPVISGASGSTEALISRLFSYVDLKQDEKELLVFAQACNMVALGHHSLFEAMIVADDLNLVSVSKQNTQMDFYLQCVPEKIKKSQEFIKFLDSDTVKNLQLDEYTSNEESTLSIAI